MAVLVASQAPGQPLFYNPAFGTYSPRGLQQHLEMLNLVEKRRAAAIKEEQEFNALKDKFE